MGDSVEILSLAIERRFNPTIERHLTRRFGWLHGPLRILKALELIHRISSLGRGLVLTQNVVLNDKPI